MSQDHAAQNFMNGINEGLSKALAGFPTLPVDVKALMETQRRNMQALSEVQQRSVAGWQAIFQRQTELVSQMLQDNSELAKEILAEGTPEEKVARQTDLFKKVYETTLLNSREIAEMASKTGQETGEIINRRVSATLNELKASLEKRKAA